jgi:hypothetical protein
MTGPSGAGSYCTQGPEIIIISPTDTEDADASIPVETAAAEEDSFPILTDFYPDVILPSPTSSVPQDFEPDLAGGGEVPPGAAPFPSGDGTELRGPGSDAEVESPTTVQSALSVLATADSDVSRAHGGTGAPVAGNINAHDDSGLTITDILPLLSNLNRTSRPTHSIVIVGLPTESSEPEEDEDAIFADDFDFDIDAGSASLRDDAVSSSIDISNTTTRTATSESSFTTVTISRTSSDDDYRQRAAQTSSGVEDDVSTATFTLSAYNSTSTLISNTTLVTITATLSSPSASETTDDEEESTTTTSSTTLRISTSASASASASAAADEDDESNAASRVTDDEDNVEQSGAAPYIPVEAAAQRVPTQSTTLLTLNAVLVGLWVLL